jgi:hypothetical protein
VDGRARAICLWIEKTHEKSLKIDPFLFDISTRKLMSTKLSQFMNTHN